MISEEDEAPMKKGLIVPILIFGLLSLALGLGSEVISAYVMDAARTLMNPDIYIDAVLNSH